MLSADQYQLLDFGRGRRLERFGAVTLDRPCPAAEEVAPLDPAAWPKADARFQRTSADEGQWTCRDGLPEPWTVSAGRLVFEMKRTIFGHVGLFPEQADNWNWIAAQVARLVQQRAGQTSTAEPRPRVLNLFAYTGGSTLAAATAGAEVAHVDAARNIVAWASRNAQLSGLAAAPIRWIAEDALKFAKRELRRGNSYDAVILDPPSYGHGPRGEVWRLSKYLPELLQLCGELTAGRSRFMLLTCHTPGFTPARLRDIMYDILGKEGRIDVAAEALQLVAATGRGLPSGVVVRWQEDQQP